LRSLLQQIDDKNDPSLRSLLRRHTLVGVVDEVFLLVQSGTQLILVDHSMLTFHLFRQLTLRRFGVLPCIVLTQPVDVKQFIAHALGTPHTHLFFKNHILFVFSVSFVRNCIVLSLSGLMSHLLLFLDSEEGQWDDAAQGGDAEKAAVVAALCTLLASKADMLREYFQIGFTTDLDTLYLVNMPELLTGHRPQPEALPVFLLRLGVEVDWTDEYDCFNGVSRELALCYSALPSDSSVDEGETIESQSQMETNNSSDSAAPAQRSSGGSGSGSGIDAGMVDNEAEEERNEVNDDDTGNSSSKDPNSRTPDLMSSAGLNPAARAVLLDTLLPALQTYVCPPKVSSHACNLLFL
jgi:DNA mismatch repair protein MLH1